MDDQTHPPRAWGRGLGPLTLLPNSSIAEAMCVCCKVILTIYSNPSVQKMVVSSWKPIGSCDLTFGVPVSFCRGHSLSLGILAFHSASSRLSSILNPTPRHPHQLQTTHVSPRWLGASKTSSSQRYFQGLLFGGHTSPEQLLLILDENPLPT